MVRVLTRVWWPAVSASSNCSLQGGSMRFLRLALLVNTAAVR